jgi:Na+-driven multidrug efflux pump
LTVISRARQKWDELAAIYPWHFIGFIIAAMLIPKFYDLSNVFWIGKMSLNSLAISEQYEFIGVTIEIVNEMIPFGILALVAQNYKNREKILEILKAGLIIQVAFSLFVMAIVIGFTPWFVSTIGTPASIVNETTAFLILKSVALPFESVALLLLIGIKSMQKGKEALYIVLISVIVNMLFDILLISNFSFSLRLGLQGVAIGYVISKIVLMIISLVFITSLLEINWRSYLVLPWRNYVKPLFSIGGWTGLDSLVRNAGYIGTLMVLNAMGTAQYGGYNLAMTVMWTLIIPVLALGEGTSVVIGNYFGEKKITEMKSVVLTSFILIIGFMAIVSILGVFLWTPLSQFFNQNPEMVGFSSMTFWWLMIPYCLFGASTIIRSIFFGTGQTRYIFYLGCIANFLLIIPFVILVKMGFIAATFENVMIQFVIVFICDPIIGYFFARRLINKVEENTG